MIIAFQIQVLGPGDDWESYHMVLLNLTTRCLCIRNDAAVFEMIKYMNDNFIHQLTPGTLLVQTMVRAKIVSDSPTL